jgi:hypothetical protein
MCGGNIVSHEIDKELFSIPIKQRREISIQVKVNVAEFCDWRLVVVVGAESTILTVD